MKSAGILLLVALSAVCAPRPERFIVILQDSPVASRSMPAKEAVRSSLRTTLRGKQESLRERLAEGGLHVTASEQVLLNALFVEGPPDSEPFLRSLPGVAWVEKLRPMKRHLFDALRLMNIQNSWTAVNGPQNAGAGVKIAIIDSGIDQTHAAFQDASLQYPSGFPKCDDSRGECAFVNTKVIAARSYVNILVGTDPRYTHPDDLSPRDRIGHGTAVAMIAGGGQISSPAGNISGAAPKVWLGNYKIFGSPGVNGRYTFEDALVKALSDAAADGMNIAVVATGASAVWGPRDVGGACQNAAGQACDWRANAVENAARLGLTVVVSAGDDGDLANRYPAYSSVNTPGTAPSAITVGASTNAHILYQAVRITGNSIPTALQQIPAYLGDGPRASADANAPVKDVATTGDNGQACSPLPDNSLSGSVALIIRGACDFSVQVLNAQRAGAVAAIIYQSAGLNGLFQINGLNETAIPAALIGSTTGLALKAFIAQQPSTRAALDPSYSGIRTSDYDEVAAFSSRGPSIREVGIKPELLAVGTDLYTATQTFDIAGELYDPSGFTGVQGTSFAAPLVAGTLAMVKQRYPNLTPAQLKSTVVNTANPNITDFDESGRPLQAGILDMGSGKLDAAAALTTNVTVEPATLSFGILTNALPAAQSLTICNIGTTSLNLQLATSPTGGSASVAPSTNRVTVAGGACDRSVSVRLVGSVPRAGEYEGFLQISGGAYSLNVPYVFMVGDNVPFSVFPLEGSSYVADTGATVPLTFKVVDQYGAPVRNVPVRFQTTSFGGQVTTASPSTDELGVASAEAVLASDPGRQEFYASVNNNQNFGLYFTGRARRRPAIAGVAPSQSEGTGQGFAPGSYLSIYGTGLSESTGPYSTSYLPLALFGVSVSFDVPAQNLSYPGRLRYVSDGQIDVQVPYELQGVTSAQVKVSIGDSAADASFSDPVQIQIAGASPSIFVYTDASGQRFASAVSSDGAILGSGTVARKGSVILLYANGLGAVDNQPASGDPARTDLLARTRVTPTVTIGGRPAEVLFSGLAPGYVGLYQLNVRVPADAPSGPQSVIITAGAVSSKPANIPVE